MINICVPRGWVGIPAGGQCGYLPGPHNLDKLKTAISQGIMVNNNNNSGK